MGVEANCVATYRRQTSNGKALLETDYLLFRGDFRLRVPFVDIRLVDARDGRLVLRFGKETAAFDLGKRAEIWAQKIRSPKSLLDKLGVKPGHAVTVLGLRDKAFLDDLRRRTPDVTSDRRKRSRDIIFLGADSAADLAAMRSLEALLAPAGAVWVVYPKGQKSITEADVLSGGRAAGLTDVKAARFSDTHTALQFVIPAFRRAKS